MSMQHYSVGLCFKSIMARTSGGGNEGSSGKYDRGLNVKLQPFSDP